MKAFVLNEGEHGWRGFLHDKDCCSEVVQKYFPGILTNEQRDLDTIFEARDESRTIVTSNGDHFIRGNPRCEDCWAS